MLDVVRPGTLLCISYIEQHPDGIDKTALWARLLDSELRFLCLKSQTAWILVADEELGQVLTPIPEGVLQQVGSKGDKLFDLETKPTERLPGAKGAIEDLLAKMEIANAHVTLAEEEARTPRTVLEDEVSIRAKYGAKVQLVKGLRTRATISGEINDPINLVDIDMGGAESEHEPGSDLEDVEVEVVHPATYKAMPGPARPP